jgi:3-phosphoshikimate 1-carboxyvinyltransferase
MKLKIYPSEIKGNLLSPASKSCMQRACAAALLNKGKSIIYNPGISNDDKAAIGIIKDLGALVTFQNDYLIVESSGVTSKSDVLNCGEAGLSIRMFTPIAATIASEITITGSGSLQTRPMDFFDEIFPQLNVKIKSNAGKLPLSIKGPIVPKTIIVDGSLSSQFLTGLLMSYSALNASNVSIKVIDLKSKPYIDLTLDVMKQFGMKVPVNHNYQEFSFTNEHIVKAKESLINYQVEGDWSGASFLLVAAAISGSIELKGLNLNSTQADRAILSALKDCGCKLDIQDDIIKVLSNELEAFTFNATECPDLFPPLVALASFCKGQTLIKGVTRLKHKESDRAMTLQEEFAKLGVKIDIKDDFMMVYGVDKVKSAKVFSHHDHRIAMACAVAALRAEDVVEIDNAEAIDKSYPNFYKDLISLGVKIV